MNKLAFIFYITFFGCTLNAAVPYDHVHLTASNARDAVDWYVKHFGGEVVKPGAIIVLQCGNRFHAGDGVGTGKNYTLFAKDAGRVAFIKRGKRGQQRVIVQVLPEAV